LGANVHGSVGGTAPVDEYEVAQVNPHRFCRVVLEAGVEEEDVISGVLPIPAVGVEDNPRLPFVREGVDPALPRLPRMELEVSYVE